MTAFWRHTGHSPSIIPVRSRPHPGHTSPSGAARESPMRFIRISTLWGVRPSSRAIARAVRLPALARSSLSSDVVHGLLIGAPPVGALALS